jgi:hypothetical protein
MSIARNSDASSALTIIVGTDWRYIDPETARGCPGYVVIDDRVFLATFYRKIYGNSELQRPG